MSEIDELLKPARLKIARAKYHVDDLLREIDSYLVGKPYVLAVRNDPKAGQNCYFIKTKKPIPDIIPLIIGDAIHNLRSALDLTVYPMVSNKTKVTQSIQFPWASSFEKLDSTIKSRQMVLAGPKVVDAIKSLNPYKGGDKAIEAVHLMDIIDKHHLILTAASTAMMNWQEFCKFVPNSIPMDGQDVNRRWMAIGTDAQFIVPHLVGVNRQSRRAASSYPVVEEIADVQPPFFMRFGDGQPLAGCMVIEAMQGMTLRIEEACVAIGKAYFT